MHKNYDVVLSRKSNPKERVGVVVGASNKELVDKNGKLKLAIINRIALYAIRKEYWLGVPKEDILLHFPDMVVDYHTGRALPDVKNRYHKENRDFRFNQIFRSSL